MEQVQCSPASRRAILVVGIVFVAAGCQNAAWKNPYAAFGPLTIPAPSQVQVPEGGYYQPPAATGTLVAAATPVPTGAAPTTTSTGPSISAVDLARMPATGPSNEPPIRIVEPGSAVPASGNMSPAPAPIREPRSAPARTPWGSAIPAAPSAPDTTSRPESTVPTIRRDSMVTPAKYEQSAFREAAVLPAEGAWQTR
jgi:hypothetical protein